MLWHVLMRLAALVAVAASAALFMHYIDPVDAGFCAAGSGCEDVRRSGFGYFGPSPLMNLPFVGLLAYGALLVTSLARPRAAAWMAIAGAFGALALLAVQSFVVGAFCWLCVVVDGAGLAAGAAGFFVLRGRMGPERLRPAAWCALLALAVVAPPAWGRVRPAPPVPGVILALYEPGKLNVVEFADFECPFCRRLHPVLKRALAEYPADRVHFVRMNVPLEHHTHAASLAAASVCAQKQAKGDTFADILVELEPGPGAIQTAVKRTGVDRVAFDPCVKDPATEAEIRRQTQVLVDAGMLGLPTTYVGDRRFVGSVGIEALREAMDQALAGKTETGLPGPAFIALVTALAAAALWFGRQGKVATP